MRFTRQELEELAAYFATPVGAKYASESFLIFADPQVMASMNEMMPAVMEAMPGMMNNVGAIAGKYPKARTFSALTPEEQDRLAALLGVTLEELSANEPELEEQPEEAPATQPMSQAEIEAEWVEREGAS